MGNVEDIVRDILFDYEPRATGEPHAFALADGMEPEATVKADATPALEFDDITRILTEITTDIVVVVDLTQETDTLRILTFGIDEVFALSNQTYFVLDVMSDGENRLPQLPVIDLGKKIGLILHRVRTGNQPFPTSLINLRLSIMARRNEVIIMNG